MSMSWRLREANRNSFPPIRDRPSRPRAPVGKIGAPLWLQSQATSRDMSVVFLGEPLTIWHVVGLLLVLALTWRWWRLLLRSG